MTDPRDERIEKVQQAGTPEAKAGLPDSGLDRRRFLGGVTLGALAGSVGGISLAGATELAPETGVHRRNSAYQVRQQASVDEKNWPLPTPVDNGDEDRYPSRIGSFHKTLPHDPATGEVDPGAYDLMLAALSAGTVAAFEAVPGGGPNPLLNPLGGLAYNLEGPDSAVVPVGPAPALASAERAAEAGELYWTVLLRDVPFVDWNTHPLVQEAADDLTDNFSDFRGPRDPTSGRVTPQTLFRVDYPGVLDGPMVSQFLIRNFTYDGIPVTPRMNTSLPGQDFLTTFDEWLAAQNGQFLGGLPPIDPVPRFLRNPRDLGMNAGFDRVNSAYYRASLILQGLVAFGASPGVDDNPYRTAVRQAPFATFGLTHLTELIGSVGKAGRHAWYQKWQVHRVLRPEAFGGLVHRVRTEGADYPIHADLLDRSSVLPRMFETNRARNIARGLGDAGSYLLPQLFRNGGPTHPSYPSGHANVAGACVTVLKAFYNEDFPFPAPRKVNADGTATTPYVAGVDGPALTLGGELNKLAHNLTFGRDLSGVHWRSDGIEGNRQGEELAIRWMREQKATYPEPFEGFNLTRFDGTRIVI